MRHALLTILKSIQLLPLSTPWPPHYLYLKSSWRSICLSGYLSIWKRVEEAVGARACSLGLAIYSDDLKSGLVWEMIIETGGNCFYHMLVVVAF